MGSVTYSSVLVWVLIRFANSALLSKHWSAILSPISFSRRRNYQLLMFAKCSHY
jgi:hypothetical protein